MIDISKVLIGLQRGIEAVDTLAPIARDLGLPSQVLDVVKLADTLVTIAVNVRDRIEEGKIVVSNDDAAAVRSILARLADINNALASSIELS